ncbi:transketolase family protein [Cyanobium sp. WAJ14-Wanaka]|uniref:transketolase family protein n=1 Tax=Cyanobium sp. WAJ14-Wanaka TaxID=2823725 RepID=UPI0020CC18D3|nr:transketolase C-terminal domain-containing protein [Cyanobium sp. WAJ14-Wanaka]MCP9775669.1 hypothetical protein [Cyanobium sp. WAJ14-Wanaka]
MKQFPTDMKSAFPYAVESIGLLSDKLVVVVGDIGHSALQGFANEYPNRYYNLGILEPTLVSVCAGLSKEGYIPLGHTIAPFIAERSLEQIKLDFCYHSLPGNLITVGSAFDYSTLGCTHHCYTDLALLSSYPNTEACYPSSPNELVSLLAQRYDSTKLTYYRMSRASHGVNFAEVSFGKNILVKAGEDITLLASGPQLKTALELSSLLESQGLTADVLYCHTYKPFDVASLTESVAKTGRLFVIEEHIYSGGLSSTALLAAVKAVPSLRFDCHCIPDLFIRKYGKYSEICEGLGFSSTSLYSKVVSLIR